ncbi:hypothetical protein M231_05415 [Tremella mesenterica]|uniref:Rho-GAP domain-containing protein n=1 Tax=Tremella mesenterica TaxID=5217 RepID=A0A4Q1BI12_TREME|nr:hypothetical protein M231_05415 [Tremella mesenterica]
MQINEDTLIQESVVMKQSPGMVVSVLSSIMRTLSIPGPTFVPYSAFRRNTRKGYWGRKPEHLIQADGKISSSFQQLREVILGFGTAEEGVFRRTSNSTLLRVLESILDLPLNSQPSLPWTQLAKRDPLLPPKVLMKLYSSLDSPLIPQSLYPIIKNISSIKIIHDELLPALSTSERILLSHLVKTLYLFSKYQLTTKMSPLALAIVVAPVLIRGPDPLEDAMMCMEPGKSLPVAMGGKGDAEGMTLISWDEVKYTLYKVTAEVRGISDTEAEREYILRISPRLDATVLYEA